MVDQACVNGESAPTTNSSGGWRQQFQQALHLEAMERRGHVVLGLQVMDACLRCQSENNSTSSSAGSGGRQDCVVVWGECNHSFHQCCMSLWIKQNNRCPLCQQEWTVQKLGK
ncbi:RING-box protein 2 [Caligus rogercresseyi]|uniref:RING-box protein 2 n=1 Tax=Caligus rogercresseyi TaxID=217165 RepID=A0A7T8K1I3_CALRO|nr:RING-box protein 2 [Caligus rogercresseyi]